MHPGTWVDGKLGGCETTLLSNVVASSMIHTHSRLDILQRNELSGLNCSSWISIEWLRHRPIERGNDAPTRVYKRWREKLFIYAISSVGSPSIQGQIRQETVYYAGHPLGDLKDPRAIPISLYLS